MTELRDALSPAASLLEISDRDFERFRRLIHQEAGIALSDGKRALLCSRLGKRLRHLGLQTYSDYYDVVTADASGEERRELVNCITTNLTSFYREAHHFEFLRREVTALSRSLPAGRAKRLRLWSAGCSTGEEPYSIAIALHEALGSLEGWDVKILATDIDTDVLDVAERGVYSLESLAPLRPESRRRFFSPVPGDPSQVTVSPELRTLVRFGRLNLVRDTWPMRTPFDFVFCRNVTIYFDRPTQRVVYERLSGALRADGYLFAGHSENLHGLEHLFTPIDRTVYQKQSGSETPSIVPALSLPATLPRLDSAPKSDEGDAVILPVGGVFASRKPALVSTVLGSCVAACLFDPEAEVGGMNHFMLPDGAADPSLLGRYGKQAMELLIERVVRLGGRRERLRAKIFGAASLFPTSGAMPSVAEANARFVESFLKQQGIPIDARRLGGSQPLQVKFFTRTGRALVRALDGIESVIAREQRYRSELTSHVKGEDYGSG
jgi:chemotaxis protein methyltransferase CheR